MGMNMYLFGSVREYDETKFISENNMTITLKQVGYWRKAWIIFYWFIKEFYKGDDSFDVECFLATFDEYVLEKLVKDCKDTIKYCEQYEAAHRNGTVKETIPDNCLLGDTWNYLFYNRYELSGYIAELEYTIELCEKLLKEDKFDEYVLELSP